MRPAREVIVQRVEPVGRGDEWNDPWMRSKSPVREKRTKRRSYSSNSSYSSSRYVQCSIVECKQFEIELIINNNH